MIMAADITTVNDELDKLGQKIRDDVNNKLDALGQQTQDKIQQLRQQATNDERNEAAKAKAIADIKELEKRASLIELQKKQNIQKAAINNTTGNNNATSGTTSTGVSTPVQNKV